MRPGHHFVFSIVVPLILGGLTLMGTNIGSGWLEERGIYPPLVMLLSTLLVWAAARRMMHSLVPVKCPHCGHHAAYEMEGRSNHFVCRNCGKST